jgi:hypothetical protein
MLAFVSYQTVDRAVAGGVSQLLCGNLNLAQSCQLVGQA